MNFLDYISIITEEIIISKADEDHDPTVEKHEYIETLKEKLVEVMQ